MHARPHLALCDGLQRLYELYPCLFVRCLGDVGHALANKGLDGLRQSELYWGGEEERHTMSAISIALMTCL